VILLSKGRLGAGLDAECVDELAWKPSPGHKITIMLCHSTTSKAKQHPSKAATDLSDPVFPLLNWWS